jgi:hypothetical protein
LPVDLNMLFILLMIFFQILQLESVEFLPKNQSGILSHFNQKLLHPVHFLQF